MSDSAPRSREQAGEPSSLWLLPYQLMVLVLFGVVTLVAEVVCLFAGVWDRTGDKATRCLRYWARICLALARLEVTVRGLERLDPRRAYVFMPNHGSFLDILLTLAYIPHNFRFIILWKLFFNPFLSIALRWSGHLPINQRSPRQSLETLRRATELLENNVSIVVFPEGTRSRTGCLQEFKTMLFVLPTRAGVPVVPVLIEGAFKALRRGRMFICPTGLGLTFLEPILDHPQNLDRSAYAQRVRNSLLVASRHRGSRL